MELLYGPARKAAIPFLALSLLGWICFVIGFAAVNNSVNYKNGLAYDAGERNISDLAIPSQRAGLLWFPHWIVVIAGPLLFICAVLHLVLAKWFTGLPSIFLTCLYLVCGGAVVYTWSVELFDGSALTSVQRYSPPADYLTNTEWCLWPLIEWVGALASIVFLTLYYMMWAWFSQPPLYYYYEEEPEEAPEDKQQETTVE